MPGDPQPEWALALGEYLVIPVILVPGGIGSKGGGLRGLFLYLSSQAKLLHELLQMPTEV